MKLKDFRDLGDYDTKNYCPIITVEGQGFYRGHILKVNGQTACYRPYDGQDFEGVAQEFAGTLGKMVGKQIGYPEEPPEDEH